MEFRCEEDFGSRSVGLLDEIVDRSSAVSFILIPFGSCIVEGWSALHECQSEGKNSPSMCCFRDKLKDSDQLPVQHEISRELFSLPCSQPEEQKR